MIDPDGEREKERERYTMETGGLRTTVMQYEAIGCESTHALVLVVSPYCNLSGICHFRCLWTLGHVVGNENLQYVYLCPACTVALQSLRCSFYV